MFQTTDNGTSRHTDLDALTTEPGITAVRPGSMYSFPPVPKEQPESRPVLAVFCHENPDSVVGRFVTNLASTLVKREVEVHLFSCRDFALDEFGVACHALGECDGGDLIAQVQEFAGRACNAFLKLFPGSSGNVTLMGFEWSTIPALSLLHGLKNLNVILSLHSLETQRSDLTSELSQKIDEIERAGLVGAKAILVHNPATEAIARLSVPSCADRIAPLHEMFPAHLFEAKLDAGAVKARYQVGPLDPMILFVGDLSEKYGPDLLVKALPGVLRNHPQARLVVAGEGDLYWPLRVFTRYLLLEHAVRLPGSVEGEALRDLIQAADVIVVPSRESTPWWPIHAAWAARRPVVATHPAAPELLEHMGDGVLVYPSENSLVWGIERVLFDAELRSILADKGVAKLDERFGWGSVAAQVAELMGAAATQ